MIKIFILFGAFLAHRDPHENILMLCISLERFWEQNQIYFREERFKDILVPDNELGEGGQGVVYKTSFGSSEVAVKVCPVKRHRKVSLSDNEVKFYEILKSFPHRPALHGCMYTRDKANQLSKVIIVTDTAGKWVLDPSSPLSDGDYPEKLHALIAVARMLRDLHEQKVVHYDFRPENVLYDWRKNSFKLIDFGMTCGEGGKTHTLNILSSPPEQSRNYKVKNTCEKAVDIWQFFVFVAIVFLPGDETMLYREFDREYCTQVTYDEKCLARVRYNFQRYTTITSIALRNSVLKGLSYRPEDRFQSMEEVLKYLKAIYKEEVGEGKESSTAQDSVAPSESGDEVLIMERKQSQPNTMGFGHYRHSQAAKVENREPRPNKTAIISSQEKDALKAHLNKISDQPRAKAAKKDKPKYKNRNKKNIRKVIKKGAERNDGKEPSRPRVRKSHRKQRRHRK